MEDEKVYNRKKQHKIGVLLGLLVLVTVLTVLALTALTVNAEVEYTFIAQPQGEVLGVNYAVNIKWATNRMIDHFNILYYDESTSEWDQWDLQTGNGGVNDYDFQHYQEESIRFKIQGLMNGTPVVESDVFTITWTDRNAVTLNAAEGEGEDIVLFADQELTLPENPFTAPQGMEFAGWQVGTSVYNEGKTVSITEHTTVSATWRLIEASPYGLWVGGKGVKETNCSDVLGDGKVSYDAANKILTLNGATVTEYYTQKLNGEDSYFGIYSEVDGLTVNLVGENKIDILDESENDTASAIYSVKPITISGTGSIDIKCWNGVMCMENVLVKGCKMSFSTIGITGMKDVAVEDATLGAEYALILAPLGDIKVKGTTVTEGGVGSTFYTDVGKITVEDSSITANADEIAIVLQDALTVKNSTLNLKAKGSFVISCGYLDFDGVDGSIKMNCDAGYAIMATDVRMKNSELDISVVATKDSAAGIFSENDVKLENCSLKIDVRGVKDVAIGIGTLDGDIKADNCTLDIVARNQGAFALYVSNVALTDCTVTATVTAVATEDTFGAGIVADSGTVKIIGGVIDLTVSGPVLESPKISSGINMTNTLLNPELVDVDLKIKAPVVMTSAPYLTLYGREYIISVSTDIYGDTPVEYSANDILTYKYFHIHGFYTVTFDANGGSGTLEGAADVYGSYTLPECTFKAPKGMLFKGWSIDGADAAPGENVTVRKDTVIKAVWEKAPVKPAEGLSGGIIALIVIGSVLVVGIGGFGVFWFVVKKKTFAEFLASFKKK